MLSDRRPVMSVLSVTLVYCGQTVGRINMKLGTRVGLGPGHIVLDMDSAPLPQKGTAPQFSAHVYCGQTAGWIKMAFGTKVAAHSLPQKRGTASQFSARVTGQTVTHLSSC